MFVSALHMAAAETHLSLQAAMNKDIRERLDSSLLKVATLSQSQRMEAQLSLVHPHRLII